MYTRLYFHAHSFFRARVLILVLRSGIANPDSVHFHYSISTSDLDFEHDVTAELHFTSSSSGLSKARRRTLVILLREADASEPNGLVFARIEVDVVGKAIASLTPTVAAVPNGLDRFRNQ